MANQLVKYADSITAFAFIQAIALGYALGGKDFLPDLRTWSFLQFGGVAALTLIVFGFYLVIVLRCHAGEDALAGKPSERGEIGKWTTKARLIRIVVVVSACILVILEFVLTWKYVPR